MSPSNGASVKASEGWALLAEFLDRLTEPYFGADSQWRLTFANVAAEKFAGVAREDLVGEVLWEALPPSLGSACPRECRQAAEGGQVVEFEAFSSEHDCLFAVYIYPSQTGFSVSLQDVTDRRRAEEDQQRLAAVVETSDDAIIGKDLNGIITSWNQGAERIYGYRADEAIGQPIWIIAAPAQREEMTDILARLRRGERIDHYETTRVRKDGSPITISLSVSPIRDGQGAVTGAWTVARDVTQQKRAEQALRASEERFRRVAESGMIGVAHWDIDGRVTFANQTFLQMIGYTEADLEAGSIDWRAITPPEWAAVDEAATRQVQQTGTSGQFEKEFVRKDGARVPVLLTAATFPGTSEQGVTLALDIADRKRAEQELKRLYEDSARAVRDREEVIAILSHDLRNLLNTIDLSSQLLLAADLPRDKVLGQIAFIRRATEQMTALITSLLDLSRIRAGRFTVAPERASARSLLESAVEVATPLAEARYLALDVELDPKLPAVRADRTRILQVFSNLLGNATKFTGAGGRITAGARQEGEVVVFSVTDTGPGIPAADVPHIFDRFWRGGRGDGRGAGLGLAIAAGIIEAHGGRIWCESEENKGATFFFTLPLAD
jgi:PAS domain S-box-containing protein